MTTQATLCSTQARGNCSQSEKTDQAGKNQGRVLWFKQSCAWRGIAVWPRPSSQLLNVARPVAFRRVKESFVGKRVLSGKKIDGDR